MLRSDVLVAGAGPAAVSAAINLCRLGLLTTVVADPLRAPLPGETLGPQARAEVQQLGFTVRGSEDFVLPSYGIEARWGQTSAAFHSYMVEGWGDGWHVDRAGFHDRLLSSALKCGVRLLHGRFLAADRTATGWAATLRVQNRLQRVGCSFLVDATGRAASIARAVGARRTLLDRLCGLSAVFDRPSSALTLRIESVPYGWWYVAPLPRSRSLVCLLSDGDIIRRLSAHKPASWFRLARQTGIVRESIQELAEPGRVAVHACESDRLEPVAGRGWVAIGDAACVFDPLASAGVIKAVKTGRDAARAAAEYIGGSDVGLRGYSVDCAAEFRRYLTHRHRHYSIETRWLAEPFWFRRALES